MSEEKPWSQMTNWEKKAHLERKISELQDNLANPNLSDEAKNESADAIATLKWRKERL